GVARLSFFLSSRRRHTRSKRDWSSDVCSSDLARQGLCPPGACRCLHAEKSPQQRGAVFVSGPSGEAPGCEVAPARRSRRSAEGCEGENYCMPMKDKIELAIQMQPCTVRDLKAKFGGVRAVDRKVMEALDELVREAVVCQTEGVFFTVRSGRKDKALPCTLVKLGKHFGFAMLEDG